jgi:hypothetical protein
VLPLPPPTHTHSPMTTSSSRVSPPLLCLHPALLQRAVGELLWLQLVLVPVFVVVGIDAACGVARRTCVRNMGLLRALASRGASQGRSTPLLTPSLAAALSGSGGGGSGKAPRIATTLKLCVDVEVEDVQPARTHSTRLGSHVSGGGAGGGVGLGPLSRASVDSSVVVRDCWALVASQVQVQVQAGAVERQRCLPRPCGCPLTPTLAVCPWRPRAPRAALPCLSLPRRLWSGCTFPCARCWRSHQGLAGASLARNCKVLAVFVLRRGRMRGRCCIPVHMMFTESTVRVPLVGDGDGVGVWCWCVQARVLVWARESAPPCRGRDVRLSCARQRPGDRRSSDDLPCLLCDCPYLLLGHTQRT